MSPFSSSPSVSTTPLGTPILGAAGLVSVLATTGAAETAAGVPTAPSCSTLLISSGPNIVSWAIPLCSYLSQMIPSTWRVMVPSSTRPSLSVTLSVAMDALVKKARNASSRAARSIALILFIMVLIPLKLPLVLQLLDADLLFDRLDLRDGRDAVLLEPRRQTLAPAQDQCLDLFQV